jgi:energy-coupling factor transporter ATP-binding protein EcfA2
MKLARAHIENFKGVKDVELTLLRPHQSKTDLLHAVLGDNGTGKTTVLQAIALTLGLATRRIPEVGRFPWYGFLPQRLGTLGKTRVELEVLLDDEEIATTRTLFEEWRTHFEKEGARLVEPGGNNRVTLVFEKGKVYCEEGQACKTQLLGRYYVRQLARIRPDLKELFGRVGDVFWYDQYRNLGQATPTEVADGAVRESTYEPSSSSESLPAPAESWVVGVEQLRRFLQDWWTYHVSSYRSGGRDFIPELEKLFGNVFSGTQFRGPHPVDTSGAEPSPRFFFLLERAGRVFDIAEMSSGEQAVFPLVYDFVRMNIRKSVVLIDELELHLHPPEQQALLTALPKIGPGCQFVITTHSSFVEGSIPNEQETRLPGGRPCL